MFDNLTSIARRIFGDANERELKRIDPIIRQINALEPAMQKLSDEQLQGKTAEFKAKLSNGASLDDILAEAFAAVRETSVRKLGMRHFDSQLIGGVVLHQGKISEMKTGEGKTLVATAPVYLNALAGNGVHVVTVNDYLAQRDADWMRPIYAALGMSVGVILQNERDDKVKRLAYACDITYGTNNEFGFDFLRDNMKFNLSDMVQRGHAYAIVDEVDSILIDEARTPLIISGPMNASVDLYTIIDGVVPLLQREVDFTVDEKSKSVTLTDDGINKVEDKLGIDNLYDPHNMEILHHVNQSLKAHYLFRRDRDYVVRDGDVIIVDEFTGRLMHGRRWSDGLHQAVEAKERVSVQNESQTYATITFQNLFRMYKKLAGMTGTASTEAAEFAAIYNLDTVVIPTNRPVRRIDAEDVIYKTQMEKFRAVVAEIEERYKHGQPVLVGTTSVEKSEIVHKLLERKGIPHEVLNAKNHAREAVIVAQAGRKGSVTISTNMAGRGTDIKLGGDPEKLARSQYPSSLKPESPQYEDYLKALAYWEESCKLEKEEVLAAGGLFIIGTERHESRRVDNQLRGRSGRQGDPGGSRFYLSLEDDLLKMFGTDKVTVWMERMGLEDDEPIEHRWITRAVENAQRKVEGHNFNLRKNLLEYDDVMNYQRKGVYEIRRRALHNENVLEMSREALDNIIQDIMDDYIVDGLNPEHWNISGMRTNLKRVFEIQWEDSDTALRDLSREELKQRMRTEAHDKMSRTIEKMGEEVFKTFARMLILQYTDSLWKDHLLAIDRLRQGVGLRGYGQRNPLLEYKKEALQMYLMMSAMRDESVITHIFHAEASTAQAAAQAPGKSTARRLERGTFRPADDLLSAAARAGRTQAAKGEAPEEPPLAIPATPAPPPPEPKIPSPGEETRLFAHRYGVRRNDPCPCGSGKKFKKCCYDESWVAPVEVAALGAGALISDLVPAGEPTVDPQTDAVVAAIIAEEAASQVTEASVEYAGVDGSESAPDPLVDDSLYASTPIEAAPIEAAPIEAAPIEAAPAEVAAETAPVEPAAQSEVAASEAPPAEPAADSVAAADAPPTDPASHRIPADNAASFVDQHWKNV